MTTTPDLAGRVALVTGGGTGIGAAIASAYAAAGAAVTVTGRRPEPLDAVVATITEAGGRALAVPADVTVLEQMQTAVGATVDRFGHLDLVVANAGAAPPFGNVLDADEDAWRTIVDLNLTGVWITAKAAVPRWSSTGAARSSPWDRKRRARTRAASAPAAAKAGAGALTRVLAAELASTASR
ncbi:MAG: SDR family NAD(P)-dependent oxidoreductase [Acidimicrobiia bacterium]